MWQRVVKSAVSFALLIGVACSDSTGPGSFAGGYRLERYEGMPLPATTYQSATTTVTIIRQSLMLGEEGTGVATMTSRVVNPARPQGVETTTTSFLRFKARSGAIEITFLCPPDAECIPTPILGVRVDGGLAIGSPVSSKPASIYKRVR